MGETVGVEEEYHVVDAATLALRNSPDLVAAVDAGRFGPRLQSEIATTQVEIATGVCAGLSELRQEIVAARRDAAAATASVGAAILASSTHPAASWAHQRLTLHPRYIELYERWGLLALQQVITGCHVHVAVPDQDTAVRVMDAARPYLPLLLALSGSSPFHEGVDTGYESYRTQWFARWPTTGTPGPLGDAAGFEAVVAALQRAEVIDDATHLYWDLRPSVRHPTLEWRIADVCTSVDDAVLLAGVVRALTTTLGDRVAAGDPPPAVRGEVLRAARWRAARHGLGDRLVDAATGDLVPAPVAVKNLLAEVRPALEDAGEWDEVAALLERLLATGTSAARQRALLHATSDVHAVVADLVRRSTPVG